MVRDSSPEQTAAALSLRRAQRLSQKRLGAGRAVESSRVQESGNCSVEQLPRQICNTGIRRLGGGMNGRDSGASPHVSGQCDAASMS